MLGAAWLCLTFPGARIHATTSSLICSAISAQLDFRQIPSIIPLNAQPITTQYLILSYYEHGTSFKGEAASGAPVGDMEGSPRPAPQRRPTCRNSPSNRCNGTLRRDEELLPYVLPSRWSTCNGHQQDCILHPYASRRNKVQDMSLDSISKIKYLKIVIPAPVDK